MVLPILEGKEIYTTHGGSVLSTSKRSDVDTLTPCNHEEADTRLMIHARDATIKGHGRIKIRSNDTEVVVLAVSVVSSLSLEKLWVTYGTGKNVRDIPVHAVLCLPRSS